MCIGIQPRKLNGSCEADSLTLYPMEGCGCHVNGFRIEFCRMEDYFCEDVMRQLYFDLYKGKEQVELIREQQCRI